MALARSFLGIDLGAESGRVVLGSLESGKLRMEEVHRFPNEPVKLRDTLTWDLPRLFLEVKRGIAAGAARAGREITGLAVDSWGVDFGLLDRAGDVLANPVHYRDSRTAGVMEEVFQVIPKETIFAETGLQFLSLNTLYQLAALRKRSPRALDDGAKLLLMADLIGYLLCGRAASEATLASTSQLWNPTLRAWSARISRALALPEGLLAEVVDAGTILAPLDAGIAAEAGLAGARAPRVIATASHDTASAVAAVPCDPRRPWAYLSSGTWSLIGLELDSPRIAPEVLRRNFTNEAGVGGTTRFLRNLNGLWLLQECRRRWAREGDAVDYAGLAALAESAGGARTLIQPGHADFFAPSDMPEAIRAHARRTGQPVPSTKGEIVRCALESLALAYRTVLDEAREIADTAVEVLHVVGGGSRNELLNQLTADACGLHVVAGPAEATAMGNILVQARATGDLASFAEVREVAHASCATREYEPREHDAWEEKLERFRGLAGAD